MLLRKTRLAWSTALLACICLAIAALTLHPARAAGAGAFDGVYACQWDSAVDAADQQSFTTFLKSGDIFADGLVLAPALTNQQDAIKLNPGHGTWKVKSGKLNLRVLFGDTNGGTRYWVLTGTLARAHDKTISGTLVLNQFASLTAALPDASFTFGFVGGSDDGPST